MHNPINQGYIQASGGHVSAQKNATLGICELEECLRALGLLLFALFTQIISKCLLNIFLIINKQRLFT